MSDASSYTPQPGSLVFRMLQYFVRNPGDDLTLRDVATKFGVNRTAVGACLAKAIRYQLIAQTRNAAQQRIYAAGERLGAWITCNPKALGMHLAPQADRSVPTAIQRAVDLGETLRLARAISDDAARSDIESNCVRMREGDHQWYDTEVVENSDVQAMVRRSLRYLVLRGHVVLHPTVAAFVRFPPDGVPSP